MKKYLITGAMALLAGFYLTSCTHDDIEYSSVYEEKTQTFEKVFHDLYGNINPSHDWGFKSLNSIATANSRTVAGTRAAGTRGENANANEWADVSNSTGYGGWKVPPALTEKQKLRVKAYFQANPDLQYNDPHLRNFFVQQVYKGATSPAKGFTEKVTAADGSKYDANKMNLLTVGKNAVHINNFNNGDATERDVLDNGANLKNHTGETYHKDKIMLMVNIDDTSCFGYHETASSNEENDPSGQHNDRCALVSASDIDTWAAANGNIGEAVFSEEWNRSFLGFDLAIKEGDQIWTDQVQSFTSGMNMGYDGLYYADNNIVDFTYDSNWNRHMPEGMSDVMKDTKGDPLKILISNTNFYSGELRTISDSDLRKDINGKVYVNMPNVMNLINEGFYPVSGSAFKTWVKPKKSYDNYFSDWIVTLTQATKVGNTEEIDGPDDPEEHHGDNVTETSTGDEHKLLAIGRVFVEDLFKATREDLDFNDAVFDAAIWQHTTNGTITVAEDGTKTFTPSENSVVTRDAEIYLIAAGGTIPLMIANGCNEIVSESNQSNQHEVHDIFGVSGVTMVNTRGQYSEAFGSYENGISPKYKKYDMTSALSGKLENAISLNDIPVDVIWTTDQFSVPASLNNARIVEFEKDPETGEYILNEDGTPKEKVIGVATAPHMIQVPLGTDWATERKNIADCYPTFGTYVNDGKTAFWENTNQESRFNLYEQNVTTFNKANYGDGETALTPRYAYYTNVQKISSYEGTKIWEAPLSNDHRLSVNYTANNLKAGDKIRIYGKGTCKICFWTSSWGWIEGIDNYNFDSNNGYIDIVLNTNDWTARLFNGNTLSFYSGYDNGQNGADFYCITLIQN